MSKTEKPGEGLDLNLIPSLHPLQEKLLRQEIVEQTAKAKLSMLILAEKEDAERDRLVKMGRVRHLFINDTIAGNAADKWLDALLHWERRDPGQPISIDIHSPGGSITDGLALFDQIAAMRRKGHVVTTRGRGMVASMAAVLMQAGDIRIMDARAKMCIHEGSSTFSGTLSRAEQEDYREFSNMLLADILDILAERSTLSRRQIQNKWSRKDWWMGAAEAVRLGFADRVE